MYWKDFKNIFEKKNEKAQSKGAGVASINVVGPQCIWLCQNLWLSSWKFYIVNRLVYCNTHD
jgi:hypothetical protein